MYPILFKIGSFPLHTFGVMLAIAILVGSSMLLRETRRLNDPRITEDRIQRLIWYVVGGVILGGRLLHVILNWHYYSTRLSEIPAIWEGGLVMYGGLISVFAVVIGYAIYHKLGILRLCDLVAPSSFLGAAIGRWGCFFAGDDYGKPTTSWVGITFTEREGSLPGTPFGIPVHPTQIYMSLKCLLIFAVCYWLTRRKNRRAEGAYSLPGSAGQGRPGYDGQVVGVALIMYAVLRSIVEIFRGDADRGFVFDGALSTSQFISIFMFAIGIGILWMAPRKPARAPAA
jgi:phosphatidylglycerol---prolipoprotein diacylglyceryl transferase